jgi:hypothetical protein
MEKNVKDFKKLKKGDKIKINFSFQGVQKNFVGLVTGVKESFNATFIEINDPEETYKTFLKRPFKYVLAMFLKKNQEITTSFMVEDGAIRGVPFSIVN